MTDPADRSSQRPERIIIKKYANRRLYNTQTSVYVTLNDLAEMVRQDQDFIVRDAKTGEDLTHSVLTQIIVEQDSKSDGPTLLSTSFLRQLIRYYDNAIARMVPAYLQISMAALAKEQERYHAQLNSWEPTNTFDIYQEQARKNLKMFEKAFAMWTPQSEAGQTNSAADDDTNTPASNEAKDPNGYDGSTETSEVAAAVADVSIEKKHMQQDEMSEIQQLKAELALLNEKIEKISRSN